MSLITVLATANEMTTQVSLRVANVELSQIRMPPTLVRPTSEVFVLEYIAYAPNPRNVPRWGLDSVKLQAELTHLGIAQIERSALIKRLVIQLENLQFHCEECWDESSLYLQISELKALFEYGPHASIPYNPRLRLLEGQLAANQEDLVDLIAWDATGR